MKIIKLQMKYKLIFLFVIVISLVLSLPFEHYGSLFPIRLSKTEKILRVLLVRLKHLRKQLLEQIFQTLYALGFHFIYSVLNNFG